MTGELIRLYRTIITGTHVPKNLEIPENRPSAKDGEAAPSLALGVPNFVIFGIFEFQNVPKNLERSTAPGRFDRRA